MNRLKEARIAVAAALLPATAAHAAPVTFDLTAWSIDQVAKASFAEGGPTVTSLNPTGGGTFHETATISRSWSARQRIPTAWHSGQDRAGFVGDERLASLASVSMLMN
ncbi:MAG: hypothetical protein AAGD11_00570 [Planctomycetota bacterium]